MIEKVLLHNGWQLDVPDPENAAEPFFDSVPAQVPGDVYSDLLRAGRMEDPFWRENESAALALMERDFVYRTAFTVPRRILDREKLLLRMEGLDTLAEVSLNDRVIGRCDNMHRTWEFDVKGLLGTENTLRVRFHSPTKYIRERYAERPLDGTPDAMCGFPYLRKAHCMFGWDWGPRLPDAGIWRPVYLLAYDTARIGSVYVKQEHAAGRVKLTLEPALVFGVFAGQVREQLSAECLQELELHTEVLDPEGRPAAEAVSEAFGAPELDLQAPRLWWPAGYGEQPLYTVRVTLCRRGGTIAAGDAAGKERGREDILDIWERRIGLRTMTVTREKDAWGESFAHTVNGVQIFAMGADYIPEDNLPGRTSEARTRRLLEDARAANFNCIRVWGGGWYPEDWFYDICDELGLIVWQDLMFACAVYRLTDRFQQSIAAEIADNVRRLRHHASLALWCGNNEMELFVGQGQWVNDPSEVTDYRRMYEELFPALLAEQDPQTFYWPASPSSGGGFDAPNDPDRGDVHYWEVWHGGRPFTDYRNYHFRYLSEFGFESFPAMRTIESFTLPGERDPFSLVMEKHQRNAAGNGKILQYLAQTYLYPVSMDQLVYASQLLQARAMRYGVEHLRRWRGRCMGAVIWQLNDCWPAASWSSIDHYGRWKALHYYERRFFSPVLLSCEEEGLLTQDPNPNAQPYEVQKSVRFNISNETMQAQDVTVHWQLRDAAGRIRREAQRDLSVPPLSACWLERTPLPEASLYGDHVFYSLERDGEILSEGSVLFCPPKHYAFEDPGLTLCVEGEEIVVTARSYACDVEIRNEEEDLLLSDNYFDMEPGEKRVRILRGDPLGLRVRSVWEIGKKRSSRAEGAEQR